MRRVVGGLFVVVGLLASSAAQADPRDDAPAQIDYLLTSVGGSGCEFYRNGSWYNAMRAEEHLRLKYRRLLAHGVIRSAEDFIEMGATRSSMSGLEYAIRCPDTGAVPAAQWLRERLASYRSKRKSPSHGHP